MKSLDLFELKTTVKGVYTFIVSGADGTVRHKGELAESPNLITNGGLDLMATQSNYLDKCFVGTGSTTPQFSDSTLASILATSNTSSEARGTLPESPYYTWVRKTYRFNEGVAAGNLSEVGVGFVATALFSRALILDALGNPTSITILPDETLDVVYELRLYPNLVDATGTMTLGGNVGGTYDWIFRASNVGKLTANSYSQNTGWGFIYYAMNGWQRELGGGRAYTGEIGDVTGSPSGTAIGPGSTGSYMFPDMNAYVAGSHEIVFRINFPLAFNAAVGIRSIHRAIGPCTYQMQFTPAIVKTTEEVLTLEFKHSWGR